MLVQPRLVRSNSTHSYLLPHVRRRSPSPSPRSSSTPSSLFSSAALSSSYLLESYPTQINMNDTSPNAVASSSRHTLPSIPLPDRPSPSTRPSSRSLRRRLNNRTIYFLLALLFPVLSAANPLPRSKQRHRSTLSIPPCDEPQLDQVTSHFNQSIHLSSAGHWVLSHLSRRDEQPILAIANFDAISETWKLPEGYVELRQHFHAGFIVLSYAIAFVGSLCTLELLIRRTTNSGWRNQLLLASAGFCFGAVSTFAMHFVFNNALSLHHPMMDEKSYPALYLSYDPGFTILSLVVSCLAMTTAFFVMGTQLRDWLVWPGQRKDKLDGRRGSPSKIEAADDYGKWKKSHKKVLRRGTLGVGALFAHASHAAKWSLMDLEGLESGGRRNSKGKGEGKHTNWKDEAQGMYTPVEGETERMFGDDDALQELDFRLGKDAVRQELERRAGASTPTSTRASQQGSIVTSHHSITPLPVIYAPSSRRSSVASSQPIPLPSPDVFTPGFNFPPKIEPEYTSSTNLISPPPGGIGRTPSPTFGETEPIYQPERRRASLPANVMVTHRDRPSWGGPSTTLARIQSLPEGDVEPSSSGSVGSIISSNGEKKSHKSASPPTITARLSSYTGKSENTVDRNSRRKVRLVARSTRLTRLGMFLGFDVVTPTEIFKIFVTGTIAGFGVVGMHYIGQASITGLPYIAYHPAYVVGSVIIACGAVIIALYIMFIMLRPKLKHTWFSKICVALILAIAVTCMHFCGMMGTTYAWPVSRGISKHNKLTGTNVVITGIVAALAFSACIACAVFFLLHSLNIRRERARRRRVVVAAVLLDDRDRVLVNSIDGMLPMCDIASLTGGDLPDTKKSYIQSVSSDSTVLGMDLTTGHDAFVSALKLSWTWKNPSLASASATATSTTTDARSQANESILQDTFADIRRGSMLTTNTTTGTTGSRPPVSVTKFLERFTISSCQLAVRLLGQTDGISRLGVLYDQILTTGWVKLNNSNDTVSKGQLIFLVRRVASAAERADLEARHFIFADSQAVAIALHKTLSVPFDHTMPLLDDMRTFCDSTLQSRLQPGKLYAGVAVVQATPFDGLRILLEKDTRSQLPMREVCALGVPNNDENELSGTVEEIGEALALLEGMTILSIMTRNMTPDTNGLLSKRLTALMVELERAIVPMLDGILTSEDMSHILPRLTLHPMLIPLTPGDSKRTISSYIPPYAIIFYANYDAAVNTFTDKWLPFSLFRAQNACVMGPKIAAAAKMDQLYTAHTSSNDTPLPGGRRPSKVQFDFPDKDKEKEKNQQPPNSAIQQEPTEGMFNDFTFPPKSGEHSPSRPSHSILGHGAGHGHGHARKSSLARSSRYNSISGESTSPSTYGYGINAGHQDDFKSSSAGVAVWEADWLLHLLRMKLRAEA